MKNKPTVIVVCEYSGIVRTAFEKRGWNAVSVDLEPSELPGKHYQEDAIYFLQHLRKFGIKKVDLLICHPPCTFLANSSAKHLYLGMKKENGRNEIRWAAMRQGADFFHKLWTFPDCEHIAVENPIMLGYAQELVGAAPSQVVQPWMFGHKEIKATCLWLRKLPKLVPTNNVKEETMKMPYAERAKVHWCPPGKDRGKIRSKTLTGLADAMAEQWGSYIENISK
jgi:hypothetical protein